MGEAGELRTRRGVREQRSKGIWAGFSSRTGVPSAEVRGDGAGLARTQEALGHPRGRHLLPQIKDREKVELFLQDYMRSRRFCESPGLH